MTKEQFLDIEKKLAKWREERGLSVEDQKKNFCVNYTQELEEFFRACRDGNQYEMIDALCDMLVVGVNAGLSLGYEYGNYFPIAETSENILKPLAYKDNLYTLCAEIREQGYYPYSCLLETIKELETRTGKWCEKEGKWIKDLGAYSVEEAQSKIYAMDSGVYEVLWALFKKETNTHYIFEVDFGTEIQKVKVKKWYKANYEKCKILEK